MAIIQINDITHREACCGGAAADELAVYDANAERIFGAMADKARAVGHEIVVLPNATGARTYSVLSFDDADAEAAHEFMQSDDADFWRYL